MKYTDFETVDAIYSEEKGNPFLEALPEKSGPEEFLTRVAYFPGLPSNLSEMEPEKKLNILKDMKTFSYPFDYMYDIYSSLYDAITNNYKTKNTDLFYRKTLQNYRIREGFTESSSYALLGISGIGKTRTLRKCLSFIPKMICHSEYQGQAVYFKQIPYILIECPFDCSIKTLALNILTEIDLVAGTDYAQGMMAKAATISTIATRITKLCDFFHFGVIVIDEIQNAVLTATKDKQIRYLMKFLLALSNTSHAGIVYSGTMEADIIFQNEEYLKRRTLGKRLLPMKKDKVFYQFVDQMWKLNLLERTEKPDPSIVNLIFEASKGVPFYIMEIFLLSQEQAILEGQDHLTCEMIKKTIVYNHIQVFVPVEKGISISDIQLNKTEKVERRGRPVVPRNEKDLLKLREAGKDWKEELERMELLEII